MANETKLPSEGKEAEYRRLAEFIDKALSRNSRATQESAGGILARTTIAGSSWWAVEPNVGRVANGIPARVDRLKGLGNAIVPQIAEMIATRIAEVG